MTLSSIFFVHVPDSPPEGEYHRTIRGLPAISTSFPGPPSTHIYQRPPRLPEPTPTTSFSLDISFFSLTLEPSWKRQGCEGEGWIRSCLFTSDVAPYGNKASRWREAWAPPLSEMTSPSLAYPSAPDTFKLPLPKSKQKAEALKWLLTSWNSLTNYS